MNKKLPCIIFKSNSRFLKDSYDIGWLCIENDDPYIVVWGNTKNKETAKQFTESLIREQGKRIVRFYDKNLPIIDKNRTVISLSDEQVSDIIACSEIFYGILGVE
jgi:hypothetical protein